MYLVLVYENKKIPKTSFNISCDHFKWLQKQYVTWPTFASTKHIWLHNKYLFSINWLLNDLDNTNTFILYSLQWGKERGIKEKTTLSIFHDI